ncbi:protein lethal(2)denticleless isoform X2 [Anabrus simplex]
MLALANEDGKIALQNICHASQQRSLIGIQAHYNAIFDLAWMENAFKLVSVSGDHTAILWDVGESELKEVGKFQGHTRSLKTVDFRPQDSAVFATGARDGMIVIWDTRCSKDQLSIKPDNFISNAHHYPGASANSRPKRNKFIPSSRASSITSLVFQDQNSLISCGAGDGLIKVWDLRKNYCVYKRESTPQYALQYPGNMTKNGFTNLVLDPCGVRLYANCMDNVIYCYNVATYENEPIASYTGHQNATFYIKSCLSPDGRYLVSGSSNERAYVWNVNHPQQPIASLVGHDAEVTSVAWCAVGQTKIVTCSDDAYHRIWEIGSDEFEYTEDAPRVLRGWAEEENPKTECASTSNIRACKRSLPIPDRTPKSARRWMMREERTPDEVCYDSSPNFANPVEDSCSDCSRTASGYTPCSHCKVYRSRPSVFGRLQQEGTKRRLNMFEEASPPPKKIKALSPMKDQNTRHTIGARNLFVPLQNLHIISVECESSSDTNIDNLPPKKRMCLSSPTMNLPNYVVDGTSPHHCCKRSAHMKENVDWLTRLRKDKDLKETHKTKGRQSHHTVVRQGLGHSDSLLRYFTVNRQDITKLQ